MILAHGAKAKITRALELSGEWKGFKSERSSLLRRLQTEHRLEHTKALDQAWNQAADEWGFDRHGNRCSTVDTAPSTPEPEPAGLWDLPVEEGPSPKSSSQIEWELASASISEPEKPPSLDLQFQWALDNALTPLTKIDLAHAPCRGALFLVKLSKEDQVEFARIARTVRQKSAPQEDRFADEPIANQIDRLLAECAA